MSDRAYGAQASHRITSVIIALALGVASFLVTAVAAAPSADAAAPTLSRVAAASASATGKKHRVVVPKGVHAGDRLVLFLTWKSKAATRRVRGWSVLESYRGRGIRAQAWTRVATAADAGRGVQVVTRRAAKGVLAVAAYRGTGEAPDVTASSERGSNRRGKAHRTPAVQVADPGSWLVNAWGVTARRGPGWRLSSAHEIAERATRGRGRVSMLVADSDGAVPVGTAGARTARTRQRADRSAMFSVVVSPGVTDEPEPPENTAPTAAFDVSCDALVCDFDASGSSDADGDTLTYAWDFGDTKSATGVAPRHEFASAGTRTVTLTVSDGTASDQATKQVTTTVTPRENTAPTASFTVSCADLVCDFDASGSTDADGDPLSYAWDFGDGADATGAAPQHTYGTAGTRTVTLTVSDGTDTAEATKSVTTSITPPPNAPPTASFTVSCAKLVCHFDAGASGDADGDPLSYAWDFGDGTTATGETADHTYASYGTRNVTLTVTAGEHDAVATRSVTTANAAPIAAFTVSCGDLECAFDARGSRDLDGDALTYEWDFGDGATATGVQASHTYGSADTRTVQLSVFDGTDRRTATKPVTTMVTLPPGDTGPQPVPGHDGLGLVPESAHTGMPEIDNGEIWDLEVVGDRAFVAGTFTSITDIAGDGSVVSQAGLAAFDLETGLVDRTFDPGFDGEVRAVEASPDGTRLYVGGEFNNVNGDACDDAATTDRVERCSKIAALDPATGDLVGAFDTSRITNNQVNAIDATDTTVYVGGRFSQVNGVDMVGLAALDAATGAVDPEFDNQLSGGIGVNGIATVQQLKLTHDNARLLVVHTARQIDGQDRYGVGIIGTVSKQLLPWKTRLWEDNLQYVGGIQRIYAGDIAPDDSYFVVSSGSGGDRPPINDTAVAFNFRNGDDVQPLWISRAFDSIYSVAITEAAIYIGGHFQWNESPTAPLPWPGLDDRGYGTGQGLSAYALGDAVVRRDHLGALNPVDGTAVEWHPGSNSFEGNKAMLATEHGLLTGGDGNQQGGSRVGRVAFFDFDDLPAASDPDTTITTPIQGRVVPAGQEFVIEGTATSTGALDRVRVEIESGGQSLQADGTWGTDFHRFDAVLGTRTGDVTPWSLPVTVPDSREMRIRARAVSLGVQDANQATKKIESFLFGDLPPSTRISEPRSSLQASTSFVLRGSATDDFGVSAVSLYLHDLDTDQYLTADGQLVDEYTTFRIQPDLVDAVDTTWQHQVTLPREGNWKVGAMAVDNAGQSDTRWATRDYTVTSTGQAPTVTITEPLGVTPPVTPPTLAMSPGGPLTFTGTAADDAGLASVEVSLRNTTTGESLAADGSWGPDVYSGFFSGWHRISPANIGAASYDWSFTMPEDLEPGTYSFGVRATDQQDLSTGRDMRGALTIEVTVPGDAPPEGLLNVTGTQTSDVLHLDLAGTATDDHGVDRVLVSVEDSETDRYLQPDGSLKAAYAALEASLATPGGADTTWSLPVDLPTNGDYAVTARAVDTVGQYDPSTSGATAQYLVFPGDAAPFLWEDLASPAEGTAFTEARVFVSGRAEDDQAIGAVEVAIVNSLGQYLDRNGNFGSSERWNGAFLNSPGSPASNYAYTSPIIPDGSYRVLVRPVDTHGQVPDLAREVTVTVSSPPGNTAPVAAGSVSCTENVCTFDGRASTDNNAATLSYEWDFGDGGDDDNALTTNTYTTPGDFVPTLTVTDEYGLVSTVTLAPITIVEPAGNLAPTAVSTTPTCVGLVCSFSGASSTDPNETDDLGFAWDFGDGVGTDDDDSPSYTFAAAGTYTVTLTVTDGWGRTGTDTVNVTVAP